MVYNFNIFLTYIFYEIKLFLFLKTSYYCNAVSIISIQRAHYKIINVVVVVVVCLCWALGGRGRVGYCLENDCTVSQAVQQLWQ